MHHHNEYIQTLKMTHGSFLFVQTLWASNCHGDIHLWLHVPLTSTTPKSSESTGIGPIVPDFKLSWPLGAHDSRNYHK